MDDDSQTLDILYDIPPKELCLSKHHQIAGVLAISTRLNRGDFDIANYHQLYDDVPDMSREQIDSFRQIYLLNEPTLREMDCASLKIRCHIPPIRQWHAALS